MKRTRSNFLFSSRNGLLGAVLSCLMSISAFSAQNQMASITGVVTDPSGGIISGAVVTVHAAGQPASSSTRTAADGSFLFSGLPPGRYELTIERDGFLEYSRRDIKCDGQTAVRADIQLELAVAVETITVTADKRETDVAILASSISVITASQAVDQEMTTALDIATQTPNLHFTNSGMAMATYTAMRGITAGMTQMPAVGFYVDDVYYSSLDATLIDIERVEVLRGPQGTLYGRNSEAGVINVITRKPSNIWMGGGSFEAGSFNTYSVQGNVSGPLVKDRLLFKAAARRYETDGYFTNLYDDSTDSEKRRNTDGQAALLLFPIEHLSLNLKYDLQRYNTPKYAAFAPIDSGDMRNNINSDYPGSAYNHGDGLSLRSTYQLDNVELTSITSWRGEHFYGTNDIDMSAWDLMSMSIDRENSLVSEEFRIASDTSESRLRWLGGVFLLGENDDRCYGTWMNFANMGMGVPGETLWQNSSTDTLGLAAFGEATYSPTRRLNLTLGLRRDYERKDFTFKQSPSGPMLPMMGYASSAGDASKNFSAWLPKAALGYALSNRVRIHASASRGFRSGGFNDIDQLGSIFEPEFTWNYEIGAKTALWRDRLRLNTAFFYIDWSQMQVEVPTQGGTSVYIDNAAKAASKGVEIELTAQPVKGLHLVAGLARTAARYDEYLQGTTVYDGNQVMDVPRLTLNFTATYRFRGVLAGLSYNRVGDMYFDSANTTSQNYGLLGARVGYEFKHYSAYVYSENLTDAEYATRAFPVNDVWFGRAGAPRSVGIRLGTRF